MINFEQRNLSCVVTGRSYHSSLPGISKGQGSRTLRAPPGPARPTSKFREGQKPDPAGLRASFKLGPAGSQRESLTLAGPAHRFASAELGVPSEVSAGQELIQPPKAAWEWGPSVTPAMASCLGTLSDPLPLRATSRNLPTPIRGQTILFNSLQLFPTRLPCDMPLQTPPHQVHPGLKSYRTPATWPVGGGGSLLGCGHLDTQLRTKPRSQPPGPQDKKVPSKPQRPISDSPTTHCGWLCPQTRTN